MIGEMVLYRLAAWQAERINASRNASLNNHSTLNNNYTEEGDVFPMLVVHQDANNGYLNGRVFVDGKDILWVRSVKKGKVPGTWHPRRRSDLRRRLKGAAE